ncbi:putative F-box protein At3g10430 [Lotus japonicus]|uniref:putative F-box protein At3g10430 n=1 Tax=Lotus japonicus TaxID=34305 RepID=UPI00258778E9|nr:putative F-box protein At3g10430 [Lotus japonicus]
MKKRTEPVKHGPIVLPSELVREILSWLPVKTLMQFKSVSKSWKSLITTDKEFSKLHLGRSPKTKHILLTLKEEEEDTRNGVIAPCSVRLLPEEPLSMIDEDRCYNLLAKYFVVGSCNSLVCLGPGNFYDFGPMDKFWVRIWNPATQLRSKKSPAISIGYGRRFGFGYDDSRDTYKMS